MTKPEKKRMVQMSLIQDGTIKKSISNIPIGQITLSPFNPRSVRPDDDVNKLAQRISRNGFEITRALWVYKNDTGYAVIAGGTRLEAARRAGCRTVPVVVHEGLTDEDKVRLSYEDNENDEYHAPVSVVDVWANYEALVKQQNWTQQRIAEAVGQTQSTVSLRLKFYGLPEEIKEIITKGLLKEGQLREIIELSQCDNFLSHWVTQKALQCEIAKIAADKKMKSKDVKKLVTKYNGLIELAQVKYDYLKTQQETYEQKNKITFSVRRHELFINRLSEDKARTKAAITQAYADQRDAYLEAITAHEQALMEQRNQAKAERLRLEQEQAKAAAIEAILSNIYLGDFYEVCNQLNDNSIDVILTDPPYPLEFLPEYGRLAEVAARVLKPGGYLLAMCGQSYLPDVLKLMIPHIAYHWTISYLTPGGQSPQIWPKKVNTFWKPVLWFVKGEYKGDWHGDVVKSDVNDNDKKHHKWGQSESGMARLVEKFTRPGDVILDPFFGGGTTGLVALQLGRQFIGIDKNDIEISKERLFTYLVENDKSKR